MEFLWTGSPTCICSRESYLCRYQGILSSKNSRLINKIPSMLLKKLRIFRSRSFPLLDRLSSMAITKMLKTNPIIVTTHMAGPWRIISIKSSQFSTCKNMPGPISGKNFFVVNSVGNYVYSLLKGEFCPQTLRKFKKMFKSQVEFMYLTTSFSSIPY